jgi:hypothetical protein
MLQQLLSIPIVVISICIPNPPHKTIKDKKPSRGSECPSWREMNAREASGGSPKQTPARTLREPVDLSALQSADGYRATGYAGAHPGVAGGRAAASNSSCRESISFLTETIVLALNALAPANANPFFNLPFLAFIRAWAMQ